MLCLIHTDDDAKIMNDECTNINDLLILFPFHTHTHTGYLNGWDYYPFNSILSNIWDGVFCFLGFDPSGDTSYDSRASECSYSYFLVLTYVLCNVVVLECIDRILQAKNQILERSMAFAVCISFSVLTVYDNSDYFGDDGYAADVANVIAIIILLIGIEIYSKDSEPDSEALTAFITP